MSDTPTSAIVSVESAWLSKTIWVAGLGIAFAVLAAFNIKVPDDAKNATIQIVTQLVSVVVPAVIILIRARYTKTVTPSSVASSPLVINQQNTIESVTPKGPVADTISIMHNASLDS